MYDEAINFFNRPIKRVGTYTYEKEKRREYNIPIEFALKAFER
jgi:hypothetical protein